MTLENPNTSESGVLRRMLQARALAKLGQGAAPQLPALPTPTPARAAATAIGRAADRLLQMPVRSLSVTPGALTLSEFPEMLPELPLIAVLQGPGDMLGAIAFCPQAVAALVEWQALGRVTSRDLERRRPTRSDALLCAEFIDALLAELAVEMVGVDGFDAIAGYHFLTHLEDPRPLSLILDDRPLRSLAFHLGMGASDMREGRVLLALPQPSATKRPVPVPSQVAVASAPAMVPVRVSLASRMQDAPVMVTGVLCRKEVSLAELRGFIEGRLLSLPRNSLTQATLETIDGQVLAVGKFGEAEGCHAIRLRDPALADLDDAGTSTIEPGVTMPAQHEPVDLSQPDPFRTHCSVKDVPDVAAGAQLTVLGA